MLLLLKAIDDRIENRVEAPLKPELRLPVEVERKLIDLFREIQTDVIEPFFKIEDLDSLESNWERWVEWFAPLLGRLVEEIITVCDPPQLPPWIDLTVDAGIPKLVSYLEGYSEALAETFEISVRAGIQADLLLMPHLGTLVSLPDPPESLVERRVRSSLGFGLAFILLLGAFERRDVGRDRVRFIVLKLKRMAAGSYMSASRLLGWIEERE